MVEWSNGSSGKEGEEKWLSGTSFRVIRFFVLELEMQFDLSFSIYSNSFPNRVFVCFYECSWHSINTLSKQSRQSSSSWYWMDGVECKFSVNTIISQGSQCLSLEMFSQKFQEWMFRWSMMSRQLVGCEKGTKKLLARLTFKFRTNW